LSMATGLPPAGPRGGKASVFRQSRERKARRKSMDRLFAKGECVKKGVRRKVRVHTWPKLRD